jgi:hypothetical protein
MLSTLKFTLRLPKVRLHTKVRFLIYLELIAIIGLKCTSKLFKDNSLHSQKNICNGQVFLDVNTEVIFETDLANI